jgi:hypothetical protein
MFPEDPSSFMADFGSPVIFGTQTTMALFDQPDHDVMSGRAQSTAYCIEYPSKDLVGLARGDVVLIGITPAGSSIDRKAAAVHRQMLSRVGRSGAIQGDLTAGHSLTMERSPALIWRSCEFGT